ncbi:unnamed protein product [Rhizoctonia solani]|uniref:Protein kinase domain-containing protein n=1 Tax=Rhizoctonia solani TaxID=456999 RepID=A0A8H3I628_9AGAM|nr:unnamed protein product [Rhizoctonia solani]
MLFEETPTRTTQSDVYALGMTMLEIFTGQVPYPERRLDVVVITAVIQGILPTRPSHLKDDEQGNLTWNLLLECWSREPSERPSARQVYGALESYTGKP